MRTIFYIIPTVILTGLRVSSLAQEVSIPDPGLNAAIREALQIPDGPLTEQDLLRLTDLEASSRNISSVTGLEGARNLATLTLEGNILNSFTLPAALTNLTLLDLEFNLLTNFSLPTGMTNLNSVFLAKNQLTSLALPADLFHLTSLDLDENQFTSLSLPAGLINLTSLFLDANQLTTLTLPPDMTNLTALSFLVSFLGGNPLTTLVLSEPLAASTNLSVNLTTLADLQSQGLSVFTYPLTVQLTSPRRTFRGAFEFTLTGPPGVYTVVSSVDLAVWSALGTITNQLGDARFNDPAPLSPQRFYRARSK